MARKLFRMHLLQFFRHLLDAVDEELFLGREGRVGEGRAQEPCCEHMALDGDERPDQAETAGQGWHLEVSPARVDWVHEVACLDRTAPLPRELHVVLGNQRSALDLGSV
eukprot:525481-Rhodomonas_salina.3